MPGSPFASPIRGRQPTKTKELTARGVEAMANYLGLGSVFLASVDHYDVIVEWRSDHDHDMKVCRVRLDYFDCDGQPVYTVDTVHIPQSHFTREGKVE